MLQNEGDKTRVPAVSVYSITPQIVADPALLQGHPGEVCSHRSAPACHGEALPDLEVLTPLVLQGQSIKRGHVHPAALADTELQLLE